MPLLRFKKMKDRPTTSTTDFIQHLYCTKLALRGGPFDLCGRGGGWKNWLVQKFVLSLASGAENFRAIPVV